MVFIFAWCTGFAYSGSGSHGQERTTEQRCGARSPPARKFVLSGEPGRFLMDRTGIEAWEVKILATTRVAVNTLYILLLQNCLCKKLFIEHLLCGRLCSRNLRFIFVNHKESCTPVKLTL